jgi:DNA-binding transcriptional LysR family regulator
MKTFDSRAPQVADLRAALALLQERTVTRAAQRLGLTQSALSYQLERMRKRFGDPLFVRVGNRMSPTAPGGGAGRARGSVRCAS